MKIKYLFLITVTLPAVPALAADNGAARGFNLGNFAADTGQKILVGSAVAAAAAAAAAYVKEWLVPGDQNSPILTRDKALENTRQHIKDLLHIAATTNNPELAEACRKNAAFGEQLLAQGISFRNDAFAKMCGNKINQPNPFDKKTPGDGGSTAAPAA